MEEIRFASAGEQGIAIQFGSSIDEKTNQKIRLFMERLQGRKEIREMIPAFCTLLVFYDIHKTTYRKMEKLLSDEADRLEVKSRQEKKLHYIPVCYGNEFGEDLNYVAEHAGVSPEEVIKMHSGRDYLIYMMGFLPGFAYLGGMDEKIFCPRLAVPRVCIPAGSVGIGGEQTGIYPLDSPGGWQLIGRTPLRPYQPDRTPAFLYQMGEYIRFCPVTRKEYDAIAKDAEKGCLSDTWNMTATGLSGR